jgi:acyl dehydratase
MKVGESAEHSQQITPEALREFSALIDDDNPVHLDDEYARARGFPAAIVHGAIPTSVLLRLLNSVLGVWPMPGDTIWVTYVAPVTSGSCLTAYASCEGDREGCWDITAWCNDEAGEKVLSAQVRAVKNRLDEQ